MTPQENADRATQAAAGMEEFMGRLTEAVEQQQRAQKGPEEQWDEHDYEKFLKECDARTEKYGELLDKYGDSDEAEERITCTNPRPAWKPRPQRTFCQRR